MRRCIHCGQVLVWREMWAPGSTNMNGAAEPARSIGFLWLGVNIGGDSTVCDVRARKTVYAEDHHEPIPLVPDLTDATAVADWLED